MDQAQKVRENKLRREAARQQLTLRKSRVRDPLALDYGLWWVEGWGQEISDGVDLATMEQMVRSGELSGRGLFS